MGPVQYFVIVLMFSAQLALTSPVAEGGRVNGMCPAGKHVDPRSQRCVPCPSGRYTTKENLEESCYRCYSDCRPEYHLKVVQNCTSTSDVKCVCEAGFTCTTKVSLSENCKYCAKDLTITEAAASTKDITTKQTPSSASSGHNSTSVKPCVFPKCGSTSVLPTENETQTANVSRNLVAILCSVVAVGCLALVILFFYRRPKDESCFKQAIALLPCNEGGRDGSHKSKESTHQAPRDSFRAKQQPSSLSAANLGPVHVHNPGTVIFSLLSHFTGQVGPTVEGGKTAEKGRDEDDVDRDCPISHPTSSPSIHLSEEERSVETDSIFFPSQEEGKDCHVSKEEVL